MDLTSTKVLVLVLLGLIKLGSGLLPLVLTRILKKRSDRFLKKFIGASEACLSIVRTWSELLSEPCLSYCQKLV